MRGPYAGEFTLYASKRAGRTGKVIAFEPDATSFAVLERNVLVGLTNVLLVKKGLWSKNGRLQITGTTVGSQIRNEPDKGFSTVPVCTLDSELQRLGLSRVDFIKMDIEGLRAVR